MGIDNQGPSVLVSPDGAVEGTGTEDAAISVSLHDIMDASADITALSLFEIDLDGAPGSLTLDGAVLRYDSEGALDGMGPTETVTYEMSFRILEAGGRQSRVIDLTITVQGRNDLPVFTPPTLSTTSTTPLLLNVTSFFTDKDTGDTLTLSSVGTPSRGGAFSGSAEIVGQQLRFIPVHPGAGDYTVPFTVTDSHGGQVEATLNVSVSGSAAIDTFTASRATVFNGQNVTLSWTSSLTSDCTLTVGAGAPTSVATSGNQPFTPNAPLAVTLSCQSPGGLLTQTVNVAWQPAIFVDDNAAAGGNGLSWATARQTLAEALAQADSLAGAENPPIEIWVKAGTYQPATPSPDSFIAPRPGLVIKGGFLQANTGTNATRSWDASGGEFSEPTIFSGGTVNKALHVITAADGNVFDGLTITNGHALGENNAARGAGAFVGSAQNVSFIDCTFLDNLAEGSVEGAEARGGGIYIQGGSVTINGGLFKNNIARGGTNGEAKGGAVALVGGTFTAVADGFFDGLTFDGNKAEGGDGVFGDPLLSPYGGDAYGGALYLNGGEPAQLTATLIYFLSNIARGGAGKDVPLSQGSWSGDGGDAEGGAIYLYQTALTATGVSAQLNRALGGAGGNGGFGDTHNYPGAACAGTSCVARWGGGGGDGGSALGGFLTAQLVPSLSLDAGTMLFNMYGNDSYGGDGGFGGLAYCAGTAKNGSGGAGGHGGDGHGGAMAIYPNGVAAPLRLHGFSVSNNEADYGDGGGGGGAGTCTSGGSGTNNTPGSSEAGGVAIATIDGCPNYTGTLTYGSGNTAHSVVDNERKYICP